jgi:hypothetical protein
MNMLRREAAGAYIFGCCFSCLECRSRCLLSLLFPSWCRAAVFFFAASLRRNFLRRHGVRRRDFLLNFFLVVLTRRCRVSQLQKSRKKNVIMQRADKRKRKRRNDMW